MGLSVVAAHISVWVACVVCATMITTAYGSELDPGDGVAQGSPDLLITAHVDKEEYCRSNGLDQVRLTIGFTYLNRGIRTLIVPMITRVSEVQVQGEMGKPFRVQHKLHKFEGISPAIYATPAPSPNWFYILSRGQSREGMPQLTILRLAPVGARARRGVLAPGQYRLAFHLNLGSRLPGDPYIAPNRWTDVGTLVLGKTPTEPLALKVSEASAVPCSPPRLIL